MTNIENNRRKYALISHQMRSRLINMVQIDRYSIRSAAQSLQIKYSTAKMIVSKFKRQGKITKLKNQIKNSLNTIQQQNSECSVIQTDPKNNQLNNYMLPIYDQNINMSTDLNIQHNIFPFHIPQWNYYQEQYPLEYFYFYQ